MHDWSLISVLIDWEKSMVTIILNNQLSEKVEIVAHNFNDFHITKHDEWGESVSLNKVVGPVTIDNGNQLLEIEIQSGDRIMLEAKFIQLPSI